MVFELYTIRDLLANECGPVFQAKNKDVADRNYSNLVKNQDLNPEEFELEYLGKFDNEVGVIDAPS